MANLFSHKLLQENIKNLTIPEMEEKIAVLQSWVNAITTQSIYKKTESECEQAFNLDIFHNVLGYTFYPTEQYTLEAKGGNEISGQKADATLGYFHASEIEKNVSLVQVAVEIKDANTSLTKSQRREGNLSPIQQGFKYKPQYNNCKWVIVTNFVEIRLFKDTQLDYELWNLVDLVNPDNNYQNFKMFWYLLNAKHLISNLGESKTEHLLSEIREKSEQITKKFYHLYKGLRFELINDIRKHNTRISLDTIVQKSQKIIDRLVFAFFCEDNDLLPQGKIRNYIEKARSMDFTPWELLKKVFKGIDSGSEMLDIPKPGYNGGLFHPDSLLDSLIVSDAICQKFINLGEYDFKEELSVNILGHIFEQSISDLEEIRIDLLGTKLKTNELGESTKSNKRKKDGIFYTPEYIVDYIVKNSLGRYLEEQFASIEKKHLKNEKQMSDATYQDKQKLIYGEYKQILENITVLDPACGSGAFLVKVFDYLLAEHKRVGEALGRGSLFDNESTYKSILQRNIYGVDLNAESVEITKLSLWLKTAEKGKKLADLDNNIKCGNSLIDDPVVAGEKAFDWNKEFAEIMSKGGFDVVVGNPPYVNIANIKSDIDRLYLQKTYKTVKNKSDLYSIFVERSVNLLRNTGMLGFIFPNSRLSIDSFSEFRKFLIENSKITQIVKLHGDVFDDATVTTIILCLSKEKIRKHKVNLLELHKGSYDFYPINYKPSYDEIISGGYFLSFTKNFLPKGKRLKLGDIAKMSVGIKTGNDSKFVFESKSVGFYPFLEGKDISRYSPIKNRKWIDYNTEEIKKIPGSVSLSLDHFKNERILFKDIGNSVIATIDNTDSLSKNTITFLYEHKKDYDIKYLLCILNSKPTTLRFKSIYAGGLHLQINQIKEIPIFEIDGKHQQIFIDKCNQILLFNKQLDGKVDFTLRFFQSKFAIEKLSTKLQKFRELDFAGFLKELKVKKLPLDTEAELMRYFEKEKAEIVALKTQIDAVDKEIDDMVFDLYGLTEEERRGIL